MPTRQATTVLVVDDDPLDASLISDALSDAGHRVVVASDGAGATAAMERETIDLAILDVKLPDIDGLVLCAKLRAKSGLPIVMCSGTLRTRDRTLSLHLGADDFIPKPFDVFELQARVGAVLRRAREGQAGADSAAGAPPPGEPAASVLSAREREVAALVAEGLSNKAIAERLVISRLTVDKHVANILAKLGLSSRVQVAVWARGVGLLAG